MNLFRKNEGMTLVELMVASSILMLISGVVSLALVRTYVVNKSAITQGLNNSNLQLAVDNFTKNVREAKQSDSGGYLILSGTDYDLKFYSDFNDDLVTERLHYFLEDGYLKLGVAYPFGALSEYPTDDDEVKIIARNIVNENDEPIFYYYDKDSISDIEDSPMTTPITPDEVTLIKLDLFSNIDPSVNPTDMEIVTSVRPRNIDY